MSFLERKQRKMLAACLLIAGLAAAASAGGVGKGEPFPNLAKFELRGDLPDAWRGKVVLVDFWASWCAPCKRSFPVLDAIRARFVDSGFVLIGINVDEDQADMDRFLKKHPVSFAVARDVKQKLVAACGIKTMPTSFLLDKTGRVRAVHSGFTEGETDKRLIEEIEELLQ